MSEELPSVPSIKPSSIPRRRFISTAAATAFGFQVVKRHVIGQGFTPPSEMLNLGCIGVGGQGGGDIADMFGSGLVNIAALCDVDLDHAAGTIKKHDKAKLYRDYRKLIEGEKSIDAVLVATPDHVHAPASIMAMRAGRHVYVEKPLAHSIEEARKMALVAKETKRVTQMGNQGHAGEGLRLTREWIQAGVIGKVTEVHVWSDRPGHFWDTQGKARPADTPPVPNGLDWDLWIGPSPMRPYHPDYCPRKWRGWWQFGCGALGDMAVHNADPAFYALDLGAPDWVEAETSPNNNESFPEWSIITYHFPARGGQPPVTMKWYDGGKLPPKPPGMEPERNLGDNGIYFVGDKGAILAGGWSGVPRLVPESAMLSFTLPPKTIERCIKGGHRVEWIQACKANKPEAAHSGFHYSAPFTESLLVGLLAVRFGKRIEWDSANLKAKNCPEAEPVIRKAYRAGYGI
jgi:predicted dehydrogenase